MSPRPWNNERELAELLIARGEAGRSAILNPDTAYFIGLKLRQVGAKPTHEEVVQIICGKTCAEKCWACMGIANMIVRAYGHSLK